MAGEKPFTIGPFVLTPDEVAKRKAFLEIGPAEEQILRDAHPLVEEHVTEIVESFYEFLLAHEHTRAILSSPGLIERLKAIQTRYFLDLTAGRYDIAYFENRLRVGLAHERVGLRPEWYFGSYSKYVEIVNGVLRRAYQRDLERFARTAEALAKVVQLDMGLAIDAYHFSTLARLDQKAADLARSNEELRRLDHAKRRLTDMIVHDLQNPLAGVSAFLEILRSRGEGLGDEDRAGLDEALARCNDLSQLILNVLQISRAEDGKLELYWENVDLREVAERATDAFALVAERGQRHLVLKNDDRPVMLRTDRSLLRRILYNLIRNGLRHTPKGSRVEVMVLAGPPPSIRVQDDGPGIAAELRDHIFERFSNTTSRRDEEVADSGLGLSFCRVAATALQLEIRLDDARDGGACFVLEPKAPHPPQSAGDPTQSPPGRTR